MEHSVCLSAEDSFARHCVRYHATENQKATFMRPISRADVARFLHDAITDTQWDGKPGIQLGGAR